MTADEDPLGWATFKFTSQLSKYRLCPNNFLNSGSQPLVPVFLMGFHRQSVIRADFGRREICPNDATSSLQTLEFHKSRAQNCKIHRQVYQCDIIVI